LQLDIKYNQRKYNLGADRNYFRVVSMASTKFCWLMGSDDLLEQDALSFIIPALTSFDIGIVQARPLNQQSTSSSIQLYPPLLKQAQYKDLNIRSIRALPDSIEYFNSCQNLIGVFSYISSIVFDKEKVRFDIEESLIGSLYAHVKPLVNEIKNHNCDIAYISKPLVVNQRGNDSFLQNWAQRTLVDFSGYHIISQQLDFCGDLRNSFLSILNREHPPMATFFIFSFTDIKSWHVDLTLLSYMAKTPNRLFVVDFLMYIIALPFRIAYSVYKQFAR
jgi:abequosyltransferase